VTAGAYFLVLLSAAAHAYWNFLLKRSAAREEVVGLSKLVEGSLLGALLVTGIATEPSLLAPAWVLPVVGAGLSLLNYLLLIVAYRHGDLSLVYPVSRGAMLAFVPPLAFVVFGEQIDSVGWAAIAVIIAGMTLMHGLAAPGAPATMWALLAALAAAGYTVWDKRAVQVLPPLTYFAAYTVIVGVTYAGILWHSAPPGAARSSLAQRARHDCRRGSTEQRLVPACVDRAAGRESQLRHCTATAQHRGRSASRRMASARDGPSAPPGGHCTGCSRLRPAGDGALAVIAGRRQIPAAREHRKRGVAGKVRIRERQLAHDEDRSS